MAFLYELGNGASSYEEDRVLGPIPALATPQASTALSKLHEFKITHGPYPVAEPTEKEPIVNPISLLLCKYPFGMHQQNNFGLVYSHLNEYMEDYDHRYLMLTAGTEELLARPTQAGAQVFWMKTYGGHEGLLEALEAAGVLRRTGQTHRQGFVELIAVETMLVVGQWANVCHNHKCEKTEQLDMKEPRMKCCAVCKEAYYCGVECQEANWFYHERRCQNWKRLHKEYAAFPENYA